MSERHLELGCQFVSARAKPTLGQIPPVFDGKAKEFRQVDGENAADDEAAVRIIVRVAVGVSHFPP